MSIDKVFNFGLILTMVTLACIKLNIERLARVTILPAMKVKFLIVLDAVRLLKEHIYYRLRLSCIELIIIFLCARSKL